MSGTVLNPSRLRSEPRTPTIEGSPHRMSYLRQWQQTPATAGFLLGNFPIALFAFSVLITLFAAGSGLLVLGIGVVILQFGLVTARGMGAVWRDWVVRADGRPIPAPRRVSLGVQPEQGVRGFLRPLTVASDWRAMLHQSLLGFVLTMITWTIALTWALLGLVGTLYWLLIQFIPQGPGNVGLSQLIWPDRVGPGLEIDPAFADSIIYAIIGLCFLLTLPPVYRGLTALHWSLASALLGETE
ncbi:sensor domain-containing protein, partial [Leucobacter sp. M11]|uniref:sensor domain-containing protein n=1 Tax=Leucobacter sp. M11 TaxID=2993565 RepID=UPI002D7F8C10